MKETLLIIVAFYLVQFASAARIHFDNNSCKTYLDYFTRSVNKNCYHNDFLYLQTPQILDKRKIPYENHTVITEDGYILTVFRILKENPKDVIVMLHPIVQDSTSWFLGDNGSYVDRFLEAGYELWLLNFRGTTYSDKHIANLPPAQYWDFSFHEIGLYDFSAVFRYINNITNTKLIAFSFSLGSSASSVYASEKPEEAKQLIKLFIAMAVPDFLRDSKTLLRVLIPFVPLLKAITRILGIYAFFDNFRLITYLLTNIVLLFNLESLVALTAVPFVGGSFFSINPRLIPIGTSTTPEATSVKTLEHYVQLFDNKFLQFDYGRKKNLAVYGTEEPPKYRIENINVPFHIILGESDILANKKGILLLYSKLPDIAKTYGYFEVPGCSHADFLIGKTQPAIAQKHILELLEKFNA
ncbi:unnamed protein product [Ceutorhynchus assimilis]|uniref:Partial AB-hydrolase lipase domain-containing protein n=1 Tax=Ceutorhynchus assimilis TaxID=467358 RepID=A0A9N9MIN9_9CUCU|nr:unnamed protein product [Ceutorhynchus assimilis]